MFIKRKTNLFVFKAAFRYIISVSSERQANCIIN